MKPSGSRNSSKNTKIPLLTKTNSHPEDNLSNPYFNHRSPSSPIMVPSSTTLMPMRTQDEINRLISGLHLRYNGAETTTGQQQVLETEKKKEVLSESSSSVTQDNSRTIENNVEENTEIITETISNPHGSRAIEKKTKIVKKTDTSKIKDTNFTQTIVRRSTVEVVTETKSAAEEYLID